MALKDCLERVRSVPELGTYKGKEKCVVSDYEALLDEYYVACGWDIETGMPIPVKLQEL